MGAETTVHVNFNQGTVYSRLGFKVLITIRGKIKRMQNQGDGMFPSATNGHYK